MRLHKHTDIGQTESHACYIFIHSSPSTVKFFKDMLVF